jgi:hypothetical protein
MMNTQTVTAEGSWGEVTFDRATGAVLDVSEYDPDQEHDYRCIVRANPDTLVYPQMDILDVGYWFSIRQGSRVIEGYEPPVVPRGPDNDYYPEYPAYPEI